jgi:inorganic pyrophosphatase
MIFAGLKALAQSRISWDHWEGLIRRNGITIDRPRGSQHPEFSQIVYPIDYGYVNETLATDGGALDLFCGTAGTGLAGTVIAVDHRRGDTEFKLLFDCSPEEIYLVNGFINFDRDLMEGVLVLRRTMAEIRAMAGT